MRAPDRPLAVPGDPAAVWCRRGAAGAACTLAGVVLSGPLALLVVNATHPQPPWETAALFARSYHPIQAAPYAGGLLLVTGLVLLVAATSTLSPPARRVETTAALLLTAIFAAFIFFNYVVQTTFIPALVHHPSAGADAIIAALTLANPISLGWGIEMWGYGFVGVATWLLAPLFGGGGLERAARRLFVGNGVMSVVGALATTARPGWVLTPAGLAAFALWNLLLAALAATVWVVFRRRGRAAA
jgi:hypothetical protein